MNKTKSLPSKSLWCFSIQVPDFLAKALLQSNHRQACNKNMPSAKFLMRNKILAQPARRRTGVGAVKYRPILKDTMSDIWKPSVTVAAIVEREGRFLLVEEETSDGIRINQPAGHLDPNESLEQAVVRETMEEAAHDFSPNCLIGMYMSRYVSSRTGREVTYLRFAFGGTLAAADDRPLDKCIGRGGGRAERGRAAGRGRRRGPRV